MKKKIDLPITGMTCASCAAAVEKALGKVDGVENAAVNFATEKALVEFGEPIDLNTLVSTVKAEGYGVGSSRVDFAVRGMTCAACSAAVERALKGLYGVLQVNVNLAAEKATVEYIPGIVGFNDFKRVVHEAGYEAEQITGDYTDREKAQREKEFQDIRRRFLLSACLTVPIFIASMIDIPLLSN